MFRQTARIIRPSGTMMSRKASSGPAQLPLGYVADPQQPAMLRYQASLPRLPVPTLESTCHKYLETVQPLLTAEEYAHTKSTVSSFLASPLAKELQGRLKARAGDENVKNWISDWWNEAAYMGYRDPVVVFVSYFFVHVDDALRKDPAKRAASLVKAMIPFRDMVESGRLEPEKVRSGAPLCMASYKWLFHSSRYPVKPSDTASKFDWKTNNHIIVIRQNRFYVLPLSPSTSSQTYSAAELEAQLNNIIAHASSKSSKGLPIGALTSDNRDKWAEAREVLVGVSARNEEILKTIEGAMMVLCLDDKKPVTRDEISWETWVGDGRNRWFDKHQLIVYENGRSGFLGEHSCMDGTPTLRMNEFVLASLASGKADLGPVEYDASSLPPVQELEFDLDTEGVVEKLVKESEGRFDELVGGHELDVLHYEGFGKRFTKHHATSPDATAQLIKQLAWYKMHNRPAVTYESAQTRAFQLGRTEVIRSASNESKAWAEAMLSKKKDPVYLKSLFQRAVTRHAQYAKWAANGEGVDRHLFGLKKSLKEGEEVPGLWKDEAFGKSCHWELSTSQLSSPFFDGWGYGEVVPDGYGLSYAIGDDYIRWTITSLKSSDGKTNNKLLKQNLEEAAGEVKRMFEDAERVTKQQGEKEVLKAKL